MNVLLTVPLLTGVVQALKIAGLPKKVLPITAALLGVAGGIALGGLSVENALAGLALGLASVGLYEAGKSAVR